MTGMMGMLLNGTVDIVMGGIAMMGFSKEYPHYFIISVKSRISKTGYLVNQTSDIDSLPSFTLDLPIFFLYMRTNLIDLKILPFPCDFIIVNNNNTLSNK